MQYNIRDGGAERGGCAGSGHMSEGEGWRGAKLARFREAVHREFGPELEKATPANVRDFMARFQEDRFQETTKERIILHETKTTYEEILKDFFNQVLSHPSEDALIKLWTLAFEMSFFNIEQHAAERLQSLFGEMGEGENGL